MNAIWAIITSTVDTANVRLRKHDSLSSGCSMRSCRRANTARATAPPANAARGTSSSAPSDSMTVVPSMMPQNPSVYSRPDAASKRSRGPSRFTASVSTKNDSATTTTVTAPSTMNTERHPHPSMRNPEMVGPMAGAKPMMSPTSPIARPYSLLGYTDSATTWMSGSAMPAPPACNRRDTSSSG